MFNKNLINSTDRLAFLLSELHNDNAPIGWEKYRGLASLLLAKFPIKDIVNSDRFFDYDYQLGD